MHVTKAVVGRWDVERSADGITVQCSWRLLCALNAQRTSVVPVECAHAYMVGGVCSRGGYLGGRCQATAPNVNAAVVSFDAGGVCTLEWVRVRVCVRVRIARVCACSPFPREVEINPRSDLAVERNLEVQDPCQLQRSFQPAQWEVCVCVCVYVLWIGHPREG
jgi:hypothetical protein